MANHPRRFLHPQCHSLSRNRKAVGDQIGLIFDDEQKVAAFVNHNETDNEAGKRTNLTKKNSCWTALISILPPGMNVPSKKEHIKIPNHAFAGASPWSETLSNTFVFIQESEEFRQ